MTGSVDLDSKKVEQTKAKTKAAFLELCSRKSLATITVKELTALAGINRSTFYSHYTDIYDLREQILDEFTLSLQHQVVPEIISIVNGEESSESILSLTNFYNDNIVLFRAFISNNFDPQLTERIQTMFTSLLYKNSGIDQRPPEHLEYLLEYMAAGHIALISKWANSEAGISAEDLIKLIKAINLEGPVKYLLKYIPPDQTLA